MALIVVALLLALRLSRFFVRGTVLVAGFARGLMGTLARTLAALRGTPWLGLLFVAVLGLGLWFLWRRRRS